MFPTPAPTLPTYFSPLLLSRSPHPSPPTAQSTLTLKLIFFSPCCQPFFHEPSCLHPASPSVSRSFRSDSEWKQFSSLHSLLQTQSSRQYWYLRSWEGPRADLIQSQKVHGGDGIYLGHGYVQDSFKN